MSNTAKKLREAIDILSGDHDWKAICAEVAKRNPSAFLDASQARGIQLSNFWEKEALNLYEGGSKVEAIKYVRNCTGMSLHAAKAAVESLK